MMSLFSIVLDLVQYVLEYFYLARTGDMIMISYLRRLGSKYDVVGVRPWNGANSYHSEHCF